MLAKVELKPSDIVVRYRYKNREEDDDMGQVFSWFSSPIELLSHVLSFEETKRDFYEVVSKDQPQKPRFDIDIDGKKGEIKDIDDLFRRVISELEKSIIGVTGMTLEKLGYKKYLSHGGKKRSGHIVLSKACHPASIYGKCFHYLTSERMPEELRKYVDAAVYSTRQNFRLLYCQKWNSGRKKLLEIGGGSGGSVVNKNISIKDFEESLLSCVPKDAVILNYEVDVIKKPRNVAIQSEEITQEIADEAMSILRSVTIGNGGEESGYDFPYEIYNISGTMILLKRLFPSYCSLHGREHESDNPYLVLRRSVIDDSYNVTFYCRRDPPKSISIGNIMPQLASVPISHAPTPSLVMTACDKPIIASQDQSFMNFYNSSVESEAVITSDDREKYALKKEYLPLD